MFYRAALAALCLLALSCSRKPEILERQRLAVLRFENLGADLSADWMGRALSEVIATGLSAAPDISAIPSVRLHAFDRTLGVRPLSAPGISTELTQALAAGANRIGYGDYNSAAGRLTARLTIMDPRTGKTTRLVAVTVAGNDVLGAANELARQIGGNLTPYPTKNPTALKFHSMALESPDTATLFADATQAIAADPNFGPAYRMLAETRLAQQDRAGALMFLDRAMTHLNQMPSAEQARIRADRAALVGDTAGRQRALADLVKASPGDALAWRTLAQAASSRRDYQGAVEAFRQYLQLEPDDVDALNQRAYAAAYAGDLETAASSLHRYQELRPADPNALDSLGDVYLIDGRLPIAESYYLQAARKNPNFQNGAEFVKAAMAHLMTGDTAGADALFKQYADNRTAAKDPLLGLYQPQWDWISGRRKAGYQNLESFAHSMENGPLRELASRAYAQLALWSLMLGDRNAAEQLGMKAASQATPASAGTVLLARFLAQPPAAVNEWAARAEKLAPNPQQSAIRDYPLAYSLLFAKEFEAAAVVLRRIYENGNSSADEGLPILLAWACLESGKPQDAAPLLNKLPVPPLGIGPFVSLYFPRFFYLRGLDAQKAGRTSEAQTNYRLFLQLSGDQPLQWGEEQRAKSGS